MNDILKAAIINITNNYCKDNGIKPVYPEHSDGSAYIAQLYEEYDINDLIKSTRHQDDKIAIETMREEFGFSEDLIQDLFDFHRDRISK